MTATQAAIRANVRYWRCIGPANHELATGRHIPTCCPAAECGARLEEITVGGRRVRRRLERQYVSR